MANFDRDVANFQMKYAGSALLMIVGAIVVVIVLFSSLKIVPTGHVGVLRLYGTEVTGEILTEGFHFANPFKSTVSMSVQIQTITETADLLSSDGLKIALDTSLLYRLRGEEAPELLRTFLMDHVARVITPNLRSAVRDAGASYSSDALYTGETREQIAVDIKDTLQASLTEYGFDVVDVLLREVRLPASLMLSIEAKQQADQEAQRMKFILQKEEQEADRKRIEAAGIREFQRIVSLGLSRQYLTWKGIEATEKLAASDNAKVVVIGSGSDGLPLILGGN